MMQSPINPEVFRVMFHVAVGALSAASLYSMYHQKYDMENSLRAPFTELSRAKTESDRKDALTKLIAALRPEVTRRDPLVRHSAARYGAPLVKLAKLEKDGKNADSVLDAVKLILSIYGENEESRDKLNSLGGFKVLLTSLSEAHRQGNVELMEVIADALHQLTEVDGSEVVLDSDVPEGSAGAATLAYLPATVKMLRILDPEGSMQFLASLTGIFANVCMLHPGAVAIGKGTDGHTGISYFLRLLEHSDRKVVANCAMAVRFLVRAKVGQEDLLEEENIRRLGDQLQVGTEPVIVDSILTVIMVMAGSKKHADGFFALVSESSVLRSMLELWVRSSEPGIRRRAEVLTLLMVRIPQTSAAVKVLLEEYRGRIEDRARRDEEEYRQKMQQMQQQQMMQRMMMQQMGMDPSMMG